MKWLNSFKSLFTKEEKNSVKTGSIKFFNRKRGYGFISSQQLKEDVFVHASALEDRVRTGDRVQFQLTNSEKGVEATNVQLLKVS